MELYGWEEIEAGAAAGLLCCKFLQGRNESASRSIVGRLDSLMFEFEVRNEFIRRFGFAILSPAAINVLRPLGPILEIGSGSGYWAWELQRAGMEVMPTDPGTERYFINGNGEGKTNWREHHTFIDPIPAINAIDKYPNRKCLLAVWPDYKLPWAAEAVLKWQGEYVAYVGEGPGGCTADDRFHDVLEEKFILQQDVDIPQFDGVHDRLSIYRRKS